MNSKQHKYDIAYLKMALEWGQLSHCKRKQVGALIVKDRMIISKGAEIVDKILKITDKDIEECVLEGAHDFEAVQKKTKVGVQDKTCIPRVKELIEFYKDKYYG